MLLNIGCPIFAMKDRGKARYIVGVEIVENYSNRLLVCDRRHTSKESWNVFNYTIPNP